MYIHQIENNIRISRLAADVLGLITGELSTPKARLRFIKNLAAKLDLNLTKEYGEKQPAALTPAQAAGTKMPFGKWEGFGLKEINDMPDGRQYLEWLCESQESFYPALQQFLRQTAKHSDE